MRPSMSRLRRSRAPGELTLDDEFAKGFGFDDFAALREAIRTRMQDDFARASRDRMKRTLLDALDKRYSFDLPEGLVSQEFDNIWRQVQAEQKRSGLGFADENTTEEDGARRVPQDCRASREARPRPGRSGREGRHQGGGR